MFFSVTSLVAQKFDPSKFDAERYEQYMSTLQDNFEEKEAENLRLCKIFAEKGKEYAKLNRGDKFYTQTVRNCQRRIKLYCGALQEAKLLENK